MKLPSNIPRLLTIAQVADVLTCSPATVYGLVETGELPIITIGKSKGYRVDPEDLEKFVAGRRFTFRDTRIPAETKSHSTQFKHLRIN